MALLTISQLKILYDIEQITDLSSRRDDSVGGIIYDETIATTCIAQATSFIEDTLSKIYSVATVEANASLQRMCADLTMFYLSQRRGTIDPALQTIWQLHLDRLSKLANGDEKLSGANELLPSATVVAPLTTNLYSEDSYFDNLVSDNEAL